VRVGDGGVILREASIIIARLRTVFGNRRPAVRSASCGYAAVDALVALMILSSTLICALAALAQGLRAADAAREMQQARSIAADLIQTAEPRALSDSGRMDGLAWRRSVSEPVLVFGANAVCDVEVVVAGRDGRRRYALRSNAVCAKERP
jgi:hypothetical protein